MPVGNTDFRHVHFIQHILHDLDGTGTACHDTGSHMAEVGVDKIGMAQHGDEHGGNAVNGGDLFFCDAVQALRG